MDAEARAFMKELADEAAEKAVHRTLITLGIDPTDPIEAQKDLAALRELRQLFDDPETQKDLLHLRRWRKSMEGVQNKGFIYGLGFLIIGAVGLAFYGVKAKFFGG